MTYNPFSLSGKTVRITGAASGIGRATAIECCRMGAEVVITDINPEGLEETFRQLPVQNGTHSRIVTDLTKEEEIESLADRLPRLDGCVNNAGIMKLVLTPFLTTEIIERIQKINLIAPMMLTRNLVKKKKMKNPSSIVFTASAGGVFRVSAGNGIYATTKCGIDAFMRTTALELGSKGIRCNSVNPGMVETNLIRSGQLSEEQLEKDKKNYPLGRYGQPSDIAYAIVYLLSDASSWMTGTALKIDGGMTLA